MMVACPKPTSWRSDRYKAFVQTLPCCVCRIEDDTIVAHHALSGPMARQAPDDTVIPLCHTHHMAIHALNGNGFFAEVEDLDEWRKTRIDETQIAFAVEEHTCETRDCRRPVDLADETTQDFWDDGKLLCASCRCGDHVDPLTAHMEDGPEYDKYENADRKDALKR